MRLDIEKIRERGVEREEVCREDEMMRKESGKGRLAKKKKTREESGCVVTVLVWG